MAATSGAIRAGQTYVEAFLEDTKLVRGLRGIQAKFNRFGASLRMTGGLLAGVGGAGVAALIPTVKAAADAAETVSKFGAVFGDLTPEADKFAQSLADGIGRSKTEIQGSMSSLQGFFVGLGHSKDEALAMSKQMQTLGLDFASFNNISDDEALGRFISAMSGSSEVLDRFGINTKAAAINAELQAQGINKTTANATEQEKVMARMAIIQRAMAQQGSIGDALRTKDSVANRMKRMSATLSELKVTIGTALLPVMEELFAAVTPLVQSFAKWVKANPEAIKSFAMIAVKVAAFGAALYAAGTALTLAGGLISTVISVVGVAGSAVLAVVTAVASVPGMIAAAVVAVGGLIAYFAGAGETIASGWGILKDTFSRAWGGIVKAVMAGDLSGAFTIATAGLKLIWAEFMHWLTASWMSATDGILKGWSVILEAMNKGLKLVSGGRLGFNFRTDHEITRDRADDLADSESDVAKARAAFDAALGKFDETKTKAAEEKAGVGGSGAGAGPAILPRIQQGQQTAIEKTKVLGGFDANVLLRQSRGKNHDREIAKNTAVMIKSLDDLARISKKAIPRFS